jgi:hypothetical protein
MNSNDISERDEVARVIGIIFLCDILMTKLVLGRQIPPLIFDFVRCSSMCYALLRLHRYYEYSAAEESA